MSTQTTKLYIEQRDLHTTSFGTKGHILRGNEVLELSAVGQVGGLSYLKTLNDLLKTDCGTFSFTHSAQIVNNDFDEKISAVKICRWLRKMGYLETDTTEQIATNRAIDEQVLHQTTHTKNGKTKKRCSLTMKGHALIKGNVLEILKGERNA